MNGKKQGSTAKTFFTSFSITCCIFIFIIGIIIVDYRGREMSFGDERLPFEILSEESGEATLEIRLLGIDESVNFTGVKKVLDFIRDFVCLPSRSE